jgi:hypothetical protein
MPYTQALLSNGMATGYHAKAAPPTVTMPRLKVYLLWLLILCLMLIALLLLLLLCYHVTIDTCRPWFPVR